MHLASHHPIFSAMRPILSDLWRKTIMNEPTQAEPSVTAPAAALAPAAAETQVDPGYQGVLKYLVYSLSLPERALRTSSAVVGGALRESTALLVPQAFQNSKTYSVMVRQMLDFLAHDVGGVAAAARSRAEDPVENFVARKAVGSFVEMAGAATLHMSPLMLLAVISDVAYGSQVFLKELSEELKQQGLIDETSSIEHADDLLAAVAQASSVTASALDTPPLSIEGLKQVIDQTREAVRQINPAQVIPQAELGRLWHDMRDMAGRENVSLLNISTAMTLYSLDRIGTLGKGALSTVRVAGTLLDRHVIEHYTEALGQIRRQGFYRTLSESSRPYIEAVWHNFSTDRPTVTEDLLNGKLLGRAWQGMRGWLKRH